ncbi:MAG: hypothetical protein KA784_00065 [Aquabacterium sp.]|nr:hypothetical protein [Aquabacterium sp.]
MAAWDLFLPLVMPSAPDAPGPLVRQKLRLAAREFCSKTRAWVQWIDASTTATPNVYTFTKPTDAELVMLAGVTVDGKAIDLSNLGGYDSDPVANAANEAPAAGTADLVTFVLLGEVTALPVRVKAVLMPTATAATCPDFLANRYLECIAAGAESMVLLVPGSLFNEQKAGLADAVFRAGINKAITQVFRGNTTKTSRSRVSWC